MTLETKINPRFAFIEAMICVHGLIRRIHLMRAFQLKEASATRTLANYRKAFPGIIQFNSQEKNWVAGPEFPEKDQPNLKQHNVLPDIFLCSVEVVAGVKIVQKKTIIR